MFSMHAVMALCLWEVNDDLSCEMRHLVWTLGDIAATDGQIHVGMV